MKSLLCLLSMISIALMSSCATSHPERFDEVQLGMEKHDVLEAMGHPKYTRRIRSVDRWGFVYYDDGGVRTEKQVHFKEGLVIYKGDRPLPQVSAEEQDRINAQENAAIAQQYTQQSEQSFQNRKQLQDDYIKYQMGGQSKPATFQSIDGAN